MRHGTKPLIRRYQNFDQEITNLKGCDVNINTFHAYKGLEFDVVFLTQLQETAIFRGTETEGSAERRLAYMAMTRARENLFMGYTGKLPKQYLSMQDYADIVF